VYSTFVRRKGGDMSIGCRKVTCAVAGLMSLAAVEVVRTQQLAPASEQAEVADGQLAAGVRQSTAPFQDPQAAVTAGYALSGGCVSGPEEGAMGVHYVNASLVGDGALNAAQPEALVYEPRNGQLQLVAVEYIVLAEQWNANNAHPPVLHGQHFHFVPAPNRSGLPAYYELHVWAWKRNPHGTFADWNPRVRCDGYVPQ
jgi:hypothetical protein